MTSGNVINRGKFLPTPPAEGVTTKTLDRPVGKVDGRSARATGRREQFNPRVHPNFLEAFRQAVKEEMERTGKPVSQGYHAGDDAGRVAARARGGRAGQGPWSDAAGDDDEGGGGAGRASERVGRRGGQRCDCRADGEFRACEGEAEREARRLEGGQGVMPSKASIAGRLAVRRGLDENEAAVYLSLSPSFFRKLVEEKLMPRPRLAGGRRIWDVEELDLAFKAPAARGRGGRGDLRGGTRRQLGGFQMSVVKLKHVDRFEDRHGRTRYYFRRGKGVRIVLPGRPGSEAFMLAYQAALAGEEVCKPVAQRGAPGTFDRLVQDYFDSTGYLRMAASTRRTYRCVIERLVRDEKIGHRLVGQMTRQHLRADRRRGARRRRVRPMMC